MRPSLRFTKRAALYLNLRSRTFPVGLSHKSHKYNQSFRCAQQSYGNVLYKNFSLHKSTNLASNTDPTLSLGQPRAHHLSLTNQLWLRPFDSELIAPRLETFGWAKAHYPVGGMHRTRSLPRNKPAQYIYSLVAQTH